MDQSPDRVQSIDTVICGVRAAMTSTQLQPDPRSTVRGVDDDSFRIFIESVRDYALLMLDPTGRIISWNAGAEAIKGYKADEIIGRHFSTFYPPESIESGLPARELVEAARDGRFEDEGWRVRKDGTRFWANVVITALRSPEGTLTGYAKVTRDLTERRRHEESLRNNEVRFRTLVEGVRDYAIYMLDPDGAVATWNAGAQQIHGFNAIDVIGTHFSRFLVPDGTERERADRELHIAAREGRFQDEGWRMRSNGTRFWANVVITAIRDPAGALLGFSKITRDLTERRRHEAALLESEERFRLLVESVVDYAIVTLDAEGMITSWNSGAERINGYRASEILGRHFSRLYPPEDIRDNKPWRQLASARERGRVNDEAWRIRKDGTQYWANNVIASLPETRVASPRVLHGHAGPVATPARRVARRHRAAHARVHRDAGARIAQPAGADSQCRDAHGAPQARRSADRGHAPDHRPAEPESHAHRRRPARRQPRGARTVRHRQAGHRSARRAGARHRRPAGR